MVWWLHQTLIYQAVAADGQTSAGTTAIVYVQASKPHFGRSACGGGQADVSVDLRGPRKAVRPGTSITMTAIIFNTGPIPAAARWSLTGLFVLVKAPANPRREPRCHAPGSTKRLVC